MIGLKKRRRIQLLLASGTALLAAALLAGYGFRDGIEYFRNPTQLLSQPPSPEKEFRLGGIVEAGTVMDLPNGGVQFRISDGANSVPVSFLGILPDLFEEGRGAIALGSFDGTVFVARNILAKHDENYMPKEVVNALKDQGVFRAATE